MTPILTYMLLVNVGNKKRQFNVVCFFYGCPERMSRDIPSDAGVLCDRAAVLWYSYEKKHSV
jgi:hypothetical protein